MMASMRYCLYCRKDKPREGFKEVLHLVSRTLRGQCEDCQEVRKKTREELEAMAKIEKERRK